jgi:hypothetical protein
MLIRRELLVEFTIAAHAWICAATGTRKRRVWRAAFWQTPTEARLDARGQFWPRTPGKWEISAYDVALNFAILSLTASHLGVSSLVRCSNVPFMKIHAEDPSSGRVRV